MADAIYSGWKQLVGRHGIGISQTMPTGTFSVGLLSTSYTFSQSHDFLDDVVLANVVASQPMGVGATFTGRTLDGPDVTFPSLTGAAVKAVLLFMDHRATTANGSTSRLIAYLDSILGLPLSPNGEDAVLSFDSAGILDL